MTSLDNRILIIFDKDGTLIDFDAMWGGWIELLAQRLEEIAQVPVAPHLFMLLGYDAAQRRTLPGSHLAVTPMAHLWLLTRDVLQSLGFSETEAATMVHTAWFVPDPVSLAKPFTDLRVFFEALRSRGHKLAVATSDDRAPTLATMDAFGVTELLDSIYCADDGLPHKPEPDIIWAACKAAGVAPSQAAMVGDSVADLLMARAAGALAVGVTTGTSPASVLQPYADVIIPSLLSLRSDASIQ
jgi:phosphoglycolate phosphatase